MSIFFLNCSVLISAFLPHLLSSHICVFVFIYTLFPLTHTNILLHVFCLLSFTSLCMFVWVWAEKQRLSLIGWLRSEGAVSPPVYREGEGGRESTSERTGVRAEKEKRGRFVLRWQGWKERRASDSLFEAHSFSHLSFSPPFARVQPTPSSLDYSSPSLAGAFKKKRKKRKSKHPIYSHTSYRQSVE